MSALERSPGYDWSILYRFEDEQEETMSVFGCMTIEEATKEARYSLDGIGNMNAGIYEIICIRREGT